MSEPTEYFLSALAAHEVQVRDAVVASERATGKLSGWAGIWGSVLHARVIMNAGSLIKVVEAATHAPRGAQLLDHFAVASIARTAMEAGVMMLYVSDPSVGVEEFEMRRAVFLLQDTCHRSRMFKHAEKNKPEVRELREFYRGKIEEMKATLAAMPMFERLTEDSKARILGGRDFFIGGIRGALRAIDWDIDEYETFESYLSGYLHSMPMSFIRVEEHGVDFMNISAFQYDLVGTALTVVTDTLGRTTDRMLQLISN